MPVWVLRSGRLFLAVWGGRMASCLQERRFFYLGYGGYLNYLCVGCSGMAASFLQAEGQAGAFGGAAFGGAASQTGGQASAFGGQAGAFGGAPFPSSVIASPPPVTGTNDPRLQRRA